MDSFRYPGRGGELAEVEPLAADCVSRAAAEANGDAVARAVTMLLDQMFRVHDGQLAVPATSVAAAWYLQTGIDPARHGVWRAQRVFGAATLLSRDASPGRAVYSLHERTALTLDEVGRDMLRAAQAARFGAWAVTQLNRRWEIAPVGHPTQRNAERVMGVCAAPGEEIDWERAHVLGWVLDLEEGSWLVQAFTLQRRAVATLTGAARTRPADDAMRTYLLDAVRLMIDPRCDVGPHLPAPPAQPTQPGSAVPAPQASMPPAFVTAAPARPRADAQTVATRGRPAGAPRPPPSLPKAADSRAKPPVPTAAQVLAVWEAMNARMDSGFTFRVASEQVIRAVSWARNPSFAGDRLAMLWFDALRVFEANFPAGMASFGGRPLLREAPPGLLLEVLLPRWGLDPEGNPTAAAVRDLSPLPVRTLFPSVPAWIRPLADRPLRTLFEAGPDRQPSFRPESELGLRFTDAQRATLQQRYFSFIVDMRAQWAVLSAMRTGDLTPQPAPVAVSFLKLLLRKSSLQQPMAAVVGWEPKDHKSAAKALAEGGYRNVSVADFLGVDAFDLLRRRASAKRLQNVLLSLVEDPAHTLLGELQAQHHVDTTLDALADLLGELGGDESL